MSDAGRPVRLDPVDLLGLGMVGIRTRKLRAALSALGISIGIATMVVVTAVPASSQTALLRQISSLGTNMLQVSYDVNQKPAVILPKESVRMAARIGPVTAASAVANLNLPVRRSDQDDPGNDSGVTALAAQDDLLPVVNATVGSGTYLTPTLNRFPTVVLGSVAAIRLGLSPQWRAGRRPQILIGTTPFTVIGSWIRSRCFPISTVPH